MVGTYPELCPFEERVVGTYGDLGLFEAHAVGGAGGWRRGWLELWVVDTNVTFARLRQGWLKARMVGLEAQVVRTYHDLGPLEAQVVGGVGGWYL